MVLRDEFGFTHRITLAMPLLNSKNFKAAQHDSLIVTEFGCSDSIADG